VAPHLPEHQRRGPLDCESVPGVGVDRGGPGWKKRPLLRPRTGKRPLTNANRIQDPLALLAKNIHLQRERHQQRPRRDGLRRGPRPQSGVPGQGDDPAVENPERREEMVRAERQKAEEPRQREQPPDLARDAARVEPDQGVHQNAQSQGGEVHAERGEVQAAGVREERVETEGFHYVFLRVRQDLPVIES
jgi:hypothetical protein